MSGPQGMDGTAYIVAGKDLKSGVPGSDSSDSNQYFELGWEVTTTYLEIAHGRRTGRFSGDELIVTASGREFLYATTFSSVITYTEFCRRRVDPSLVLDLVARTSDRYTGDTWLRKLRLRTLYLRWFHLWRYRIRYRRLAGALPMALPPIDASAVADEFFCLCIRFRDHQPQRNLPADYLHSLLDALSATRCFLVGHGAEDFIRHPRHRVCTLAEFAALARHRNCRAVIGTMTGPIQLAQMIHPARLVVIDLDDHYHLWGRSLPCVLSDMCNFPRARHSVYNYRPSVAQLLEDLSAVSPASRVTPESYARDRAFFDAEVRMRHAFFEHDEPRAPEGAAVPA